MNTAVYWLHSTCLCCQDIYQMFVIGTLQYICYTPCVCVVRMYIRYLLLEHSSLLATLHVSVLSVCKSDVCHRNIPVYWLHSTCQCCQDVNQMFFIGTFQSIGYTHVFVLSGCISDVCPWNTPVYWLHSTCLCCLYVNQMFVIGTFQSIGYTPRFCVVRLYIRCLS